MLRPCWLRPRPPSLIGGPDVRNRGRDRFWRIPGSPFFAARRCASALDALRHVACRTHRANIAGLDRCPRRAEGRTAQGDPGASLEVLFPFSVCRTVLRCPEDCRFGTIPLRRSPAFDGPPLRSYAIGSSPSPQEHGGWPVYPAACERVGLAADVPGGSFGVASFPRRRTRSARWNIRTAWSGMSPTTLVGFGSSQFCSGSRVRGRIASGASHVPLALSPIPRFLGCSGSGWVVRVPVLPTAHGHRARLLGFPSVQPCRADTSARPLLP